MEIYLRGKTWWYDFTVGTERTRKSARTKDRREAERIARDDYRDQLARPKFNGVGLFKVLANWLNAEERSDGDRRAVALICSAYPNRPAVQVDDPSLRAAFADKSPATYNRHLNIIRAALHLAAKDRLIPAAPILTPKRVERPRLRFLTAEEWLRLRAELPEHLRDMAEFTLATGLRKSNVTGLQWSQVDVDRAVAWIHPDEAKGGRAISVPLNDLAIEVLRRRVGRHKTHVFTYNGRPMKWINSGATTTVGGTAGGSDENEVVRKPRGAWGKALARAGIEGFRWHDLRRTWASWHVMNGTPLAVLRELGGWSDLDMVQIYAQLSPEHVAKYAGNVRPPVHSRHSPSETACPSGEPAPS